MWINAAKQLRVLAVCLLFLPSWAYAVTCTTTAPGVWDCGTPTGADDLIVNHDVTITGAFNLSGSIIVNDGSTLTFTSTLSPNSSATINIAGTMEVADLMRLFDDAILTVTNTGTLNALGDLRVGSGSGSATININNGGQVNIVGSFRVDGSATGIIDGTVNAGTSFVHQGSLTGDGTINYTTTCSGGGSINGETSAVYCDGSGTIDLSTLGNFIVYNTNDSGAGSLRQAILNANASPGTDNITFNIPGAGPHTIQPLSALPDVTDPVVIDGNTQPGAQCNTVAAPGVSDAVLMIEIDGSLAGAGVDGLTITAGSTTIRGFVINRFDNNGMVLSSGSNIIECNYIGTDTSGTLDLGNNDEGVQMGSGANNNTIGGTTPQARNLVSGNGDDGVIVRSGASGNMILGNFIGTDVTGTLALGNDGSGIHLYSGATGNNIGGTATGSANLISSNNLNGLHLNDAGTSGNQVMGNLIGTDINGAADLGNIQHGIFLEISADGNTLGGTAAGSRNIISGNDLDGISSDGVDDLTVQGNYIGTDVTGTLDLGNGQDGVDIVNTTNSTIGGTIAAARNIISGNGDDGVDIDAGSGNTIQGNYIGTDVNGTGALGNSGDGVLVELTATNNTIGGSAAGAGNLISANGSDGMEIRDAGTSTNFIYGNYIGTDLSGILALGNTVHGINLVSGSTSNTIGGANAGEGNLVSGNIGSGIQIADTTTTAVSIKGNLIGTQADGTSALGNGVHGVLVSNASSNNVIGGILAGDGNTIAHNSSSGVTVHNGSTGISIVNNQIFSNTGLGIDLSANAAADGVSANDTGDGDSGGNQLLNFPVITRITQLGPNLEVLFELDVPNGNYRVEFFDNPSGIDPSDHGEGELFLDFVTVAGSPGSTHSVLLSGVTPSSILVVTATATEDLGAGNYGHTSEFSSVINYPVAVDDLFNTNEDTPLNGNVLANDSDPNGDPLTVSLITDVTNGTLVLNSDGTFTYTPASNYNGGDSFVYEVCDDAVPTVNCAQANVNIIINPINDPPLAVDDPNEITNEDVPMVNFVLNNDSDPEGDVLTIVSITQPVNGTTVNNGNGTITYTPFPNFSGVNTYTYTISDGKGGTATATVTVTVNGFNDPPTAALDIVATLEDMAVTINVLANDLDVDGDALSISSFTQPANGTLVKNPDDTFTYTPDPNYYGLDTFDYTITDGNGGFASTSVTVVVASINDAPIAVNDTTSTNEDTAVILNVISNDTDIEGDPLQVVIVTQGGNGSVNNNNDGTVTYFPFPNYNGTDSFTYTITDGNGGISTASVLVNISPANDAPVAVDDFQNTEEDTKVDIAVLSNDIDIDGDVINITTVTDPVNGEVEINPDGTIEYEPDDDFNGTDTFTYTITDGNGAFDTGTVTVVVGPLNDEPIANNDSDFTLEDQKVVTNVLANDEDPPDNDPLVVVSVTQPIRGNVINNKDGTITYSPRVNFNGVDIYTYTISDGKGGTSTATVTIIVIPVNDPPVAVLDIASTTEDTSVTVDVVDNDFDVDGDALSVAAVTQGTNGSVVDNGNGTVTYTPNTNFTGVDTFTYTISDGNGEVATTSVSIWVGIVNDPPVAIDDIANTLEDIAVTTNVLANDSDPEGDPLTIIVVTNPTNGSVTDNGDGTITYTPNPNYVGTDTYSYTITDGNGGTDMGTVTVVVNDTNDDPQAVDDFDGTNEDNPVTTDVLANDSDPEGDAISITSLTQPMNGVAVNNGNGTITYTPNTNFNGQDTYTYSITDGNGGTATGTATIFINAVPDPPTAVDDILNTSINTAVIGTILANDFDVDGDVITLVNVSQGNNGLVVDNGDGTITYTPNTGFVGIDIFNYTITDGNGFTASATVTVFVGISNNPPAAVDDNEVTNEDNPVITNVLNLDSDPDGDPLTVVSITQPTNGFAVNNGDGTVTYTPDPNFNGPDNYTYTISDGRGGTSSATVSITVNPVNDPPVANDDFKNTNEDTAVIIAVLSNDTDVDGDILGINGFTQGVNGSVSDNGDGTLTYLPNSNFSGNDIFTYTVGDGNGGTDMATVTVVVGGLNDPPNAVDDADATDEDNAVTTDVLANDNDVEGDPISIVSITQPANGVIVDNGDGTITYTPNTNFNGTDSYTYTITDGNGGTAAALVTITVNPINDPPVAIDDLGNTTDEDTAININLVLNDSDVDGSLNLNSITIISPPSNGTLVDNGDGTLTYTPDLNYNGPDTFTYTINDNDGATSNVATVDINVRDLNDQPIALNDTTTTIEETAVIIDVAANDSDVDGSIDLTTIGKASSPANGSVVINGDGTITYTPDLNFVGLDSLTYTIDDNDGGTSNVATVFINVTNANDDPVAVNDSLNTVEDTVLSLSAPGVLANDNDIDGDVLAVTGYDALSTQGGTVALNADGSLSYTPPLNFTGSDTFTYIIGDGNGGSSTATVVINVVPDNDPPTALDDSYNTNEDTGLTIVAPGILVNDSDPEGDNLSVTVTPISGPGNGTLVLNSDGSFTYNPDPNYNGPDSFTYEVCDDGSPIACNQAIVTITVNAVNDEPVAADDSYNTDEDVVLNIVAPGVLTNDSDEEGDPLIVTAFDAASTQGGTVTVNSDGSLSYTPPADFIGDDTFTYTIEDGNGGSATAMVTITVASINDPPIAMDDSYTTDEETLLVIAAPGVLTNDSDPDGDPITVTGFDAISVNGGTVSVNGDGSFEYTPDLDFAGPDTFTYTIDDGNGGTDSAMVTINVQQVNDTPTAVDDSYMVDEDATLVVIDPMLGVLNNDNDTEGHNLVVSTTAISGPSDGTLVLNADGTFTYTPDANFNGVDSFIYEVCDDGAPSACAQGSVIITINPQQDPPTAVDDSIFAVLDTPLSVPAPGILANDFDIDGDILMVSSLSAVSSSGGILIWNPDGSFNYTPPAGFTGIEVFSYTLDDGNGGADNAEIIISVFAFNDPPVAVDDIISTEEGITVDGNVLNNDSDANGDNLIATVTAVSGPANGSVLINSDGSFTYTPNPGFSGTDSFIYEVCDDGIPNQCAQGTVNIEVAPFPGLIIYQGVSPNNDGTNDRWTIEGIERFPNNRVQIFNRWGHKIYDAQGYNNNTIFWEGQSSGGLIFGENTAPDGTYFYVLDPGDGSRVYSGYIVLKK